LLVNDPIATMKITLAFVVALLACQLERAIAHAPEKPPSRELRLIECAPCRLIDPEHQHSSPYRASREMLTHVVAFENDNDDDDNDVTDPEFRLARVSDRGGADRLVSTPSRPSREPAPTFRRMLVSSSLRC
jgi:hypothetical protein